MREWGPRPAQMPGSAMEEGYEAITREHVIPSREAWEYRPKAIWTDPSTAATTTRPAHKAPDALSMANDVADTSLAMVSWCTERGTDAPATAMISGLDG